MLAVILAGVVATGAEDVPEHVVERARAIVARVLEGVPEDIELRVFRTRARMEAEIRSVEPRPPAGLIAFYHYRTRTIFACMAPRPDPALFETRLPGLMAGALVHEAQHARGALLDSRYRSRGSFVVEGTAERDTVAFLRAHPGAGRGAWELMLESRRWRLAEAKALRRTGARLIPAGLAAAERATWYTLAYAAAIDDFTRPDLDWILFDGSAEPIDGGYRLVAERRGVALLLRAEHGPLHVEVEPVAGRGPIELVFGFESEERYATVAFRRHGGVRARWLRDGRWTADPVHPAPPLRGRVRLSLERGAVSVDGTPVLYVQRPPGRVGVAVRDSAADFATSSS